METEQSDEMQVVQQKTKRLRLLLADDDAVSRMIVEIYSKKSGWEIIAVDNGEKAFDLYKQNSFDVVLMDVQMPVMDGFDATKKIRAFEIARGIHTPIIAITAFAHENDKEVCLEAGMDAYFSKPFDINTFRG